MLLGLWSRPACVVWRKSEIVTSQNQSRSMTSKASDSVQRSAVAPRSARLIHHCSVLTTSPNQRQSIWLILCSLLSRFERKSVRLTDFDVNTSLKLPYCELRVNTIIYAKLMLTKSGGGLLFSRQYLYIKVHSYLFYSYLLWRYGSQMEKKVTRHWRLFSSEVWS